MNVPYAGVVRFERANPKQRLNRPASGLSFEPGLEQEYRIFFVAERRNALQAVNVALALIVAAAAVNAIWGEPLRPHIHQIVRLSVIEAGWLAMAVAACWRGLERQYLRIASIASIVIAVVSAIEVGHRINAGQAAEFGAVTAYSLGLFFLFGLLYRAAVLANVMMVISLAATLEYLRVPTEESIGVILLLVVTAVVGGFAFYLQAVRMRRSYLDRRLIADMAMRDGLTGLRNRRAFDEHLISTWRQAARERCALAMLMIDVDHFKQFNDLYGHQAGDEALKQIAAATQALVKRPLDMAARFGGEEFAVILFGSSGGHAAELAESIRAAVEALEIAHAGNTPERVTVSIGAAVLQPTAGQEPELAVRRADEAMYFAKRDGRNCVRMCAASPMPPPSATQSG